MLVHWRSCAYTCFQQVAWPSGLRRWFKAPCSLFGGAGSNPAAATVFLIQHIIHLHSQLISWCPIYSLLLTAKDQSTTFLHDLVVHSYNAIHGRTRFLLTGSYFVSCFVDYSRALGHTGHQVWYHQLHRLCIRWKTSLCVCLTSINKRCSHYRVARVGRKLWPLMYVTSN